MYVLVLGLDVLGNPFGLFRDLSEGVEAFFYEPYQVIQASVSQNLECILVFCFEIIAFVLFRWPAFIFVVLLTKVCTEYSERHA